MLRHIQRSSTIALIVSPIGILLLAATRVLIVSDYNLSTALAILSSSGYINTLIGSVIPLVPVLMPYVALLLLYLGRMIAALLAFAAALLISPASIPGVAAVSLVRQDWHLATGGSSLRHLALIIFALFLGALLLIEIAGFQIAVVVKTAGTVGIIAVLPLLFHLYPIPVSNSFYTNVLSEPWLPAEMVTLNTHKVVTGYVLESDQDWFEVLLAQDRIVVEYHTGAVVSRTMCQTASAQSKRPLVPLVPAVSHLPVCLEPMQPAGTSVPAVERIRSMLSKTPVVLMPPLLPQSGPVPQGSSR